MRAARGHRAADGGAPRARSRGARASERSPTGRAVRAGWRTEAPLVFAVLLYCALVDGPRAADGAEPAKAHGAEWANVCILICPCHKYADGPNTAQCHTAVPTGRRAVLHSLHR